MEEKLEQQVNGAPEQVEQDKSKELKTFKHAFVLFSVGQILMLISQISTATSINGVPQILVLFALLVPPAYFISFIALAMARKINADFMRSLIAFSAFLIIEAFILVCNNSQASYDHYLAKGLSWAGNFMECVYYLYFFHGTSLVFKEHGMVKEAKKTKVSLIIFTVLFIITCIFEYLSTAKYVRMNRFTNRFFLYGFWILLFLFYLTVFIALIFAWRSMNKIRKKGANNG